MKYIEGLSKVYQTLSQLKYASIFDQYLAISSCQQPMYTNAKMVIDEHNDVTIYTYLLSFRTPENTYWHVKHRAVTYPNGLTYYAPSMILVPNGDKLTPASEPADARFMFINCDFVQFYFARFDYNVSTNSRVKHQVLSVIQNHVANYLMSLGLSCTINPIMDSAIISIFVPSQRHNRIYDYLCKLDWYSVLSPFKHLFNSVKVQTKLNEQTFDLNPAVPDIYQLQLTLKYNGLFGDDIAIEIDFNDNNYFTSLVDDNYDEIDGWTLFPQLKTIYTQPTFTTSPVQKFIVYGKVPQIVIHPKYLPIWRVSVLKLYGFKIDNNEYWLNKPIYVSRFYAPRHADAESWNTYLSTTLRL
jgi:hypothetical protein